MLKIEALHLQDHIFPVSLLTPTATLPYACSSQTQGFPAIFLTLPFAYNHMSFLQRSSVRLLLVLVGDLLTVGCLTRYDLRETWMYLSQMFLKAGGHREQRVATLYFTENTFVPLIFRFGLLVLEPYMIPHFVFPEVLKFVSQILTATTMPFWCIRIMDFPMSF